MTVTTIPLSELVLDYNLYPRPQVDSVNRSAIASAIEAGEVLPPIVADAKSKRITDGFHRYHNYKHLCGIDHIVEVELIDYANDAEAFLDAFARNSRHGRRLSPLDVAHSIGKARGFDISTADMARAAGMTEETLERIIHDRFASNSAVPLRGAFRKRWAGRKITRKVAEANLRAGGFWNALGLLSQLIDHLESDVVPFDDERVIDRLKRVHELTGEILEKQEVA